MDRTTILKCKLITMFPEPATRSAVQELLDSYGSAGHEREPERVRLAILKLAGSSIGRVRASVEVARQDYRDVLAWAEYPHQIKAGPNVDPAEKQDLIRRDREQYEAWLRAESL